MHEPWTTACPLSAVAWTFWPSICIRFDVRFRGLCFSIQSFPSPSPLLLGNTPLEIAPQSARPNPVSLSHQPGVNRASLLSELDRLPVAVLVLESVVRRKAGRVGALQLEGPSDGILDLLHHGSFE